MLFSPQIPLQLEPPRPDRFEDFVAGPNAAALEAVRPLLEETGASLFLSGPEGCGKSHLLNALCHAARERGRRAVLVSCGFMNEAPLGELCDSSDDCVSDAEFCFSYFETTVGHNICTKRCNSEDACSDVPGTTCTSFGPHYSVCLPD